MFCKVVFNTIFARSGWRLRVLPPEVAMEIAKLLPSLFLTDIDT
jgi:hypothetical protein